MSLATGTGTISLTLADLARLLRESAGEEEGVDLNGDVADTTFMDLGYDSLALLEVVGQIRREYGITIPDDAVMEAETPAALLEVINTTAQQAA